MTTPVVHTNWQKFALLLMALGVMGLLVILGEAEWADVSTPFGLIVGYGTANGIGARKGAPTAPLFSPVNPHRRVTDSGQVEVIEADPEPVVVELTPDQLDQLAAARRAEHAAARRAEPES